MGEKTSMKQTVMRISWVLFLFFTTAAFSCPEGQEENDRTGECESASGSSTSSTQGKTRRTARKWDLGVSLGFTTQFDQNVFNEFPSFANIGRVIFVQTQPSTSSEGYQLGIRLSVVRVFGIKGGLN